MSELDSRIKWKTTGVNGHTWETLGEYLYTSDVPPVEAEEYDRVFQCAHTLEVQLATVTAERDAAVSALALATNSTPGHGTGVWVPLDKWTEIQARLAAADTETTEQAWEIAKLRYCTESLERLLTPEQRQAAATEAQAALALHNPPEWCKVTAAT